jgi:hypothetical protein
MWANHDWVDIHPAKRNVQPDLQFPGAVTPEAYDRITSRVVAGYFNQSNYWLIDGKPYFSFYDLSALIKSFGSLEATREALDAFRAKTRDAGFPGLHINAVVWGRTILPREESISGAQELIDRLGFDSVTSYVWIHHVPLNEFPQTPFAHVMDKYFEYAREAENTHAVPYYPNVTMGWDASPRTVQSDMYDPLGYPFMASIGENTPQAFGRAVERVLEFLQGRPAAQRIFNINCWNEWTEGSYLEPDKRNGFGYLEALRDALAAVRQTS